MKRKILALFLLTTCVLMTACNSSGQDASSGDVQDSTTQQEDSSSVDSSEENKTATENDSATENTATTGTNSNTSQSTTTSVSVLFATEDMSCYTDADDIYFSASFSKPVVTIDGNEKAAAAINQFFEEREAEFVSEVENNKADARMFYDSTGGESYYLCSADMTVGRADAGVISLIETEVYYLGGAHGGSVVTGYNFDAATGELLLLEDLAEDSDAFYQMVKADIISQCQAYPEQMAFYSATDSQEFALTIDDVLASNSWYFTETGIEIIANPYFIGPYAAGSFEFEIPYDQLDGLKETYSYAG